MKSSTTIFTTTISMVHNDQFKALVENDLLNTAEEFAHRRQN